MSVYLKPIGLWKRGERKVDRTFQSTIENKRRFDLFQSLAQKDRFPRVSFNPSEGLQFPVANSRFQVENCEMWLRFLVSSEVTVSSVRVEEFLGQDCLPVAKRTKSKTKKVARGLETRSEIMLGWSRASLDLVSGKTKRVIGAAL